MRSQPARCLGRSWRWRSCPKRCDPSHGITTWHDGAEAGAVQAQEKRSRDVAALKRSALEPALAAVQPPPLAAALRAYFAALRLEQGADNAARFDYAKLRAPLCDAYAQLAGAPYAAPTLDLDAPLAAAGAAAAGRKRRAPRAAAVASDAPEAEAAPKRKSTRRG